MGKLLYGLRRVANSSPNKDICKTSNVGVDAADNLGICWDVGGFALDVVEDSGMEEAGCLPATCLAGSEELVFEDHAIAVNEDENKRITFL
jgi:hypothetical protein